MSRAGKILCGIGWLLSVAPSIAQESEVREAVPLEPVEAVIDAFATHEVVAIPEGAHHGNEQGHALIRRLIQDPRLAQVADDIVVEWGNSLYQSTIDRYVGGEDIPYSELRQTWENTTQYAMWDSPVFQRFFATVRSQNQSLPPDRQLRVLLGDPPIDWQQVESQEDWGEFIRQRDSYPADLVRREVIAKDRRALLIYGPFHFVEREMDQFGPRDGSIAVRLARDGAATLTVLGVTSDRVSRMEPAINGWDLPRLTMLQGTELGIAPLSTYLAPPGAPPERVPRIPTPTQQVFDALLVMGPQAEMTASPLPRSLCVDVSYMEKRLTQMPWSNNRQELLNFCQTGEWD